MFDLRTRRASQIFFKIKISRVTGPVRKRASDETAKVEVMLQEW